MNYLNINLENQFHIVIIIPWVKYKYFNLILIKKMNEWTDENIEFWENHYLNRFKYTDHHVFELIEGNPLRIRKIYLDKNLTNEEIIGFNIDE
ncbi:MAG: hypothetical protein H7A23_00925 [Leptospiraceae bacterium]|nr:hypothetical protein [Leptospiraceae bacterium]MCP5493093.1 hypothetical protein [Leptospiraceae bacterium]